MNLDHYGRPAAFDAVADGTLFLFEDQNDFAAGMRVKAKTGYGGVIRIGKLIATKAVAPSFIQKSLSTVCAIDGARIALPLTPHSLRQRVRNPEAGTIVVTPTTQYLCADLSNDPALISLLDGLISYEVDEPALVFAAWSIVVRSQDRDVTILEVTS